MNFILKTLMFFFSSSDAPEADSQRSANCGRGLFFGSKEIFHRTASCYHGTMPGSCSNHYSRSFFLKPRKALQHEFVAEKVEKPPEPVDTEPILRAFLNCFLSLQVFRLELKFSRCFLSLGKNAHRAKKLTQQLQQKRNSTAFLAQFKQSEVAIHLYYYISVYSLRATGRP